MAAYVRQAGSEAEAESPYPFPEERSTQVRIRSCSERVTFVDPDEKSRFLDVYRAPHLRVAALAADRLA